MFEVLTTTRGLFVWLTLSTARVLAADYALLVGVERYSKSTGLNTLQFSEFEIPGGSSRRAIQESRA